MSPFLFPILTNILIIIRHEYHDGQGMFRVIAVLSCELYLFEAFFIVKYNQFRDPKSPPN